MPSDGNRHRKRPSAESMHIPSSVKKAGADAKRAEAEAYIAQKRASDDWVHISKLCEDCRSSHTGSGGLGGEHDAE